MMEKSVQAQSIWPRAGKDRPEGDGKAGLVPAGIEQTTTAGPVETDADERVDPFSEMTIGYLVRDVHRAFTRSLQARIANHGVSMGQWFFLRALWDEDGLTQRELSQRVGMMEPTTVTALNGMERRGLVERVRNAHDRRKVNIFLTPKGRALRDVLLPCSKDVNDLAILGLPARDVRILAHQLRQMIKNLNGAGNGNGNGNGNGHSNGNGNGSGENRPFTAGEDDFLD